MRNDEARIQADIVHWLRLVAPHCIVAAIPNGGLRTRAEASLLKWTGVLAGAPDLIVLAPGACLGLEVKTPAGRLTPEQKSIGDWWQALGHPWALVRSLDDARAALQAAGIETREAA